MLSWIFTSEGVGELLISLQIFLAGFLTYSVFYALKNLIIWEDIPEDEQPVEPSAAQTPVQTPESAESLQEQSAESSQEDQRIDLNFSTSSEEPEESPSPVAETEPSTNNHAQAPAGDDDTPDTIDSVPEDTCEPAPLDEQSQDNEPSNNPLNESSVTRVPQVPGTVLYSDAGVIDPLRPFSSPASGMWLGMDNLNNRLASLQSELDELNVATVRNVASGIPVLGRRKRRKQLENMVIEEIEELARVVSCAPFRPASARKAMTCLAQMERFAAKKNYGGALEELSALSQLFVTAQEGDPS